MIHLFLKSPGSHSDHQIMLTLKMKVIWFIWEWQKIGVWDMQVIAKPWTSPRNKEEKYFLEKKEEVGRGFESPVENKSSE